MMKGNKMGIGIALGIGVGIAVGTSLGNVGIGIAKETKDNSKNK
jgi:hypothetical protein